MNEPLLIVEGPLQTVEHGIEGVSQLLQIIVGPQQSNSPTEIGRLNVSRNPGDPSDRHEHAARCEPAHAKTDEEDRSQSNERVAPQGVERLRVDLELERLSDVVTLLFDIEGRAAARARHLGGHDLVGQAVRQTPVHAAHQDRCHTEEHQ